MILNRFITIILFLSFMLPSISHAEGSVFAVSSQQSESKLLVQEGLLVAIDGEEFRQYLHDASISNAYGSLALIASSLATAIMLFGILWIQMELKDLRKAIRR